MTLIWPYKKNEDITRDAPAGGHGGADPKLRKLLFEKSLPDPLNQRANLEEGIQAVLVGLAVNQSMVEKVAIDVQTLRSEDFCAP